jgi:ammonia channel protein AmtB
MVAVLLIWIGWLEPRLAAAPEDATALVLASWAAAAGALVVAALFNGVLRGGADRLASLPAALMAGIVAAPAASAATAGSGMAVPFLFGALVGLLHGLLARVLQAGDSTRELAAAFTIAGLAAALAPALVGPDGFLFVPVAEDLPVQLLGLGVALVLGMGGGLSLGLLLRLLPGLLSRRPVDPAPAPSPAAATAA